MEKRKKHKEPLKIKIDFSKIRSKFHRPTLVHKSKKLYSREREKQKFRKELKYGD